MWLNLSFKNVSVFSKLVILPSVSREDDDAQIIDLTSEEQTCSIANLPANVEAHVGTYMQGKIMGCTAYTCYVYFKDNDTWTLVSKTYCSCHTIN